MTKPVPTDSSLARLVGLYEAHHPGLYRLVSAETEQQFVEATESSIDRAIRTIESGSKRYSALDERGLSGLLADLLNMAGYQAAAEREHNGHVDVVIEHLLGGRWKYLAECKLHRGFAYHVEGCEQLLGYCTGRELRALSLDFFKVPGMFEKLKALRDRMDEEKPLEQADLSVEHTIKGAFVTSNAHSSGGMVQVLHAGCAVPDL